MGKRRGEEALWDRDVKRAPNVKGSFDIFWHFFEREREVALLGFFCKRRGAILGIIRGGASIWLYSRKGWAFLTFFRERTRPLLGIFSRGCFFSAFYREGPLLGTFFEREGVEKLGAFLTKALSSCL